MKRSLLVLALVALVATLALPVVAMADPPPVLSVTCSGTYANGSNWSNTNWSSTNVTVSVTAAPANVGGPAIGTIDYEINGPSIRQAYVAPFVVSAEGINSVSVHAIDINGQVGTTLFGVKISRTVKLSTPACSPTKPTHTKTTVFSGKVTPVHKAKISLTFTKKSGSTYKTYKKISATSTTAGKWSYKAKLPKGNYKLVSSTAVDNVNGYRAGKSATRAFTVK